ncbi:MAG: MFS transporter [Ruminococcaceae bacterium]|nr:MFS transporter [Oscillospiraceae bacterium]
MENKLWTKNFTLIIIATTLGAIGGAAGNFALSFLVFEETKSTFAAALTAALAFVPAFIIPFFAAPWMDRLPRKPFLIGGDMLNGICYGAAGFYLLNFEFSYVGYLGFSLLVSSLQTFDELAYNSIYPNLIPKGMEQKGYSVLGMLYPVLRVLMMPVAAVLYGSIGVGMMLIMQGVLSVLAAFIESGIKIDEKNRLGEEIYTFSMWKSDIAEAAKYLKKEKGLRSIYSYMAFTNGIGNGYNPLLVAFFSTAAGMTAAMYSLFSAAEFIGRSIGGTFAYKLKIKPEKRFSFAFLVYMVYETMDIILLWIPYPLMLINRGICGFLGINSATMREAAVQTYIPDELRARLNAFEDMLYFAVSALLGLIIGALGEILDYRICITLCGASTMVFCWLTIWKNRGDVSLVYKKEGEN